MQEKICDIASEPVMARPMTSFVDVMGYLHSIRISTKDKARVGLRLLEETTGRYISEAFERVDHLAQLRDDWDGNGAFRISSYVLQNIREVLLISDDEDWQHWMISPDVNGTLILQSDLHVASLSIGEHEFSYLSRKDGIREGKSHLPFEAKSFLSIMRRIY